ncbi:ribonuclease T2 family protein [Acuticoccus sediminis]|uniref:ribonuclease T2 family protein n=1 Tax=Acuticoccus sediminis TaxID=2184697 RepID=UPI001CFCDB49|nr:ribonuclease T [Acuticoccus sediminis]
MRTIVSAVALAAGAGLWSGGPGWAGPMLEGWFIAEDTCPATRKIDGSNPGNVATEPRVAYDILEINRDGGDFYRIRIPGAPQIEERWVAVRCGTHVVAAGPPRRPSGGEPGGGGGGDTELGGLPTGDDSRESTDNLLAASWQPGFCETGAGRPKTECMLLNAGQLPDAADRFSMHGLWPQPNGNFWCTDEALRQKGIDNEDMLPLALSDATREALADVMPGTHSEFQRYQFYKHGSCFFAAGGAEEYFRDAINLFDQLNASPVAALFRDHIGERLSPADVKAAFDTAFGPGAGRRVQFECDADGRRDIYIELRIALRGRIDDAASLGDLILAAPPASDTAESGCARAVVDRAGLQ